MAFRIPHILTAMALLLLAGVLSWRHFESLKGPTTVPGIVVIDMIGLSRAELESLAGRWKNTRVEQVAAEARPMSPFGLDLVASLGARNVETMLYTVDPAVDREHFSQPDGGWRSVLGSFPLDDPRHPALWATDYAASFVRTLGGTQPFLVGLAVGQDLPPDPGQALAELVDAVAGRPSFARSAIVVLGAPVSGQGGSALGGSARRWVLRIDVGTWSGRERPELGDLLDVPW